MSALTRQPVLDIERHVDLVGDARHRHRLVFDGLEIRQALQADLRAVQQLVRQVGALHLAHLAPQHLVVDLVDALEVDVAHVNAAVRLDEHRDVDGLVFAIQLRQELDLGIGVAVGTEPQRHQLGGLRQQALVEDVAGLGQYEPQQVFLRHDQLAGDLDVRERVDLSLGHVDGDEHVLAIRRDRNLRRRHAKVGVTAVQVVTRQRLEVAGQRLARVAIVLSQP